MEHQTETIVPREAMPVTKDLFNITEKIPPEKLYGLLQFMRGVRCGLDMADNQAASRPGG